MDLFNNQVHVPTALPCSGINFHNGEKHIWQQRGIYSCEMRVWRLNLLHCLCHIIATAQFWPGVPISLDLSQNKFQVKGPYILELDLDLVIVSNLLLLIAGF